MRSVSTTRRLDHASADDTVAVIPHTRLSRRDRALGLVEAHLGAAVGERPYGGCRRLVIVADAGRDPGRGRRSLARAEVDARDPPPVLLEGGRLAHPHPARIGVQIAAVERP